MYWAIASYLGNLATNLAADNVAEEWLLTIPDKAMKSAVSTKHANAATLEEKAPELYALVKDPSHKWIPKVLPNGNYQVKKSNNTTSTVENTTSGSTQLFSALASIFVIFSLI